MAMQLSGSLNLTGSLNVSGSIIGSISATNGIVSSSTQVQNYDVFALNSNLYNSTGSIKGEIAGIEAYTASLKGAAIVSSSQQITNYYKFAETASANTFYGNQTISGTLTATTSTTGATIKLGGFTNYGTIQDVNDVRRIWFENVGSYRTIFDLPASGSSFAFRTYDGTALFNVNSGSGASVGTGDLTITNGNLVVASGKGIDFSATSNGSGTTSSELLNDYEEGTWTPTLGGGGSDPTGVTYDVQTGNYTKVGRLVTINFIMGFTTYTGGTGAVFVRGLPFACAGGNAANGAGQLEQFSFTGGRTYATLRVNSGDSVIDPQQMGASTSWTAFTHGTNITSSGTGKYITGTVTYTT